MPQKAALCPNQGRERGRKGDVWKRGESRGERKETEIQIHRDKKRTEQIKSDAEKQKGLKKRSAKRKKER